MREQDGLPTAPGAAKEPAREPGGAGAQRTAAHGGGEASAAAVAQGGDPGALRGRQLPVPRRGQTVAATGSATQFGLWAHSDCIVRIERLKLICEVSEKLVGLKLHCEGSRTGL